MKKILILVSVLFLVGCSGGSPPEAGSADAGSNLQDQLVEKDARISELEVRVGELNDSLSSLQGASASDGSTSSFLCDATFGNMKYQNPKSAVAILEGWFALQDNVQEMQGTFSTEFWVGVQSLTHTIRYIDIDTEESVTTSFMVYFEEAGWSDGLFWVTEQCWLDFPE